MLKASREYQSTVSNTLREQVLAAPRELLRWFEHADRAADGAILGDIRREHLQQIYIGLVIALMRIVFILFAEERGLLPMDKELYATSYSLSRLYAQLVEDEAGSELGLMIDTAPRARVTTLFRLLHDGVRARDGQQDLVIPERRGAFFDPDAFPFLEGRPRGSVRQIGVPVTVGEPALDRLEGHPRFHRRTRIALEDRAVPRARAGRRSGREPPIGFVVSSAPYAW